MIRTGMAISMRFTRTIGIVGTVVTGTTAITMVIGTAQQ
jgi:hypothetical protein